MLCRAHPSGLDAAAANASGSSQSSFFDSPSDPYFFDSQEAPEAPIPLSSSRGPSPSKPIKRQKHLQPEKDPEKRPERETERAERGAERAPERSERGPGKGKAPGNPAQKVSAQRQPNKLEILNWSQDSPPENPPKNSIDAQPGITPKACPWPYLPRPSPLQSGRPETNLLLEGAFDKPPYPGPLDLPQPSLAPSKALGGAPRKPLGGAEDMDISDSPSLVGTCLPAKGVEKAVKKGVEKAVVPVLKTYRKSKGPGGGNGVGPRGGSQGGLQEVPLGGSQGGSQGVSLGGPQGVLEGGPQEGSQRDSQGAGSQVRDFL